MTSTQMGLVVPGMPISERRQIAMIREMTNKEAATPTETSGKLSHFVFHYRTHFTVIYV